ncbi:Holliday junction resolvase RuvX [Parahaliea mediterranea]|uniref:Putative pre-16S rRNA nuclease n=2 Tax=Parahaliea mediterranea TaxID=651086 RepID=A0A939DFL5_9GAMM|nr:Holliday junction resolvase RuvX [Parahaliea mediterranea]MBN7797284.1 Holliday junction resolvase RuvX [Parahaliea mediterranea]
MAFDYGLRQIGVAVGNCLLGTTQPLTTLPARDGVPDWTALGSLVAEWQPDVLVVGEPLNMDGSNSELSARAGKFARRLHGRLGLPVELADERLSSFEAKEQQRERGHRGDYKARPVDSYAAELILQTWLRERGLRSD